jgi:hypothetical protein
MKKYHLNYNSGVVVRKGYAVEMSYKCQMFDNTQEVLSCLGWWMYGIGGGNLGTLLLSNLYPVWINWKVD